MAGGPFERLEAKKRYTGHTAGEVISTYPSFYCHFHAPEGRRSCLFCVDDP